MIAIHVTTTIFRSKHDFQFGSFYVKTGGAWLEIWGRLKTTGKKGRGKECCHARLVYSNGKGKSCDDFSKTDETQTHHERDRLIDFLNEKI